MHGGHSVCGGRRIFCRTCGTGTFGPLLSARSFCGRPLRLAAVMALCPGSLADRLYFLVQGGPPPGRASLGGGRVFARAPAKPGLRAIAHKALQAQNGGIRQHGGLRADRPLRRSRFAYAAWRRSCGRPPLWPPAVSHSSPSAPIDWMFNRQGGFWPLNTITPYAQHDRMGKGCGQLFGVRAAHRPDRNEPAPHAKTRTGKAGPSARADFCLCRGRSNRGACPGQERQARFMEQSR